MTIQNTAETNADNQFLMSSLEKQYTGEQTVFLVLYGGRLDLSRKAAT